MRTVSGVITVVQEGRFRLAAPDGGTHLFVLSHACAVEPQDLPPLQRSRTRVAVEYEDSPDLLAGIVHRLRRLPPATAAEAGAGP